MTDLIAIVVLSFALTVTVLTTLVAVLVARDLRRDYRGALGEVDLSVGEPACPGRTLEKADLAERTPVVSLDDYRCIRGDVA